MCYKASPRYEGMTLTVAYYKLGKWYNYRREGFSHPLSDHKVIGWKYVGRWKEGEIRRVCEVNKIGKQQAVYRRIR